jgi:putative membrane protein
MVGQLQHHNSPSLNRAAKWGLISSAVIALISVFGFKFFTLNPELLARFDWAMALYPYSYKAFAQAQIFTGWLAAVLMLTSRTKWAWLKAFAAVYAISLFSEFSGTSWGLPFGHYEYTDLLGFKLLDKVPWLIPMSWFFMGFAAYRLTIALLGPSATIDSFTATCTRLLLATGILLLWDVTLDPAMSKTTPFWIWEQEGSYYGMPALNIFGWAVTGLAIMIAIDRLFGPIKTKQVPANFFVGLYATNLILPLGLLAAVEAWIPLGLTVAMGWLLFRAGRWLGWRVIPRIKMRQDLTHAESRSPA